MTVRSLYRTFFLLLGKVELERYPTIVFWINFCSLDSFCFLARFPKPSQKSNNIIMGSKWYYMISDMD